LFQNNNYIYRPDAGKRGVHELAIFLTRGRLNYPSVVFLDEGLENPQPVSGFQNPVSMDKLLKFFGEDYYKTLDWGIFKQIYESPLEGRGAIDESDDSYDIKPINPSTQKIETPATNQKQAQVKEKTNAAVNSKSAPVAPKPTEKVEKAATKATEQKVDKATSTKKTKANRRTRKGKK
jgi:hypothetical protein